MSNATVDLVQRCARCGLDHPNIRFQELTRPLEYDESPALTHWATCPTTGEPILMRIEP